MCVVLNWIGDWFGWCLLVICYCFGLFCLGVYGSVRFDSGCWFGWLFGCVWLLVV